MNCMRRIIAVIGLIALSICLINVSAIAQEAKTDGLFPAGVIVVPQGTDIAIDDDAGTVTITDCPVEIAEGDTFVVYLQDLPIGYDAKSIVRQGQDTVISAEKADKTIYSMLDEEGEIAIDETNSEFIPLSRPRQNASGVTIGGDNGLSYQDGRIMATVSLAGSKAQAYLDNIVLSHSISDGNISVSLSGTWGIKTKLKASEVTAAAGSHEIPIGEIRIYGVGKIGISLSVEAAMELDADLSGTFRVGFATAQDGKTERFRELKMTKKSVSGKGELSVALKVTAGVDILVAAADIFAEIGAKTQYTAKDTTHIEGTPPNTTTHTVHCDDFRIFMFVTAGVEAKFCFFGTGKMLPISKNFIEIDENNSPVMLVIHLEDGVPVTSCSEGMTVPKPDFSTGGFTTSFGSTLLSDNRERVLDTSVTLPCDMEVDDGYTIAAGGLDLNGHTLTINGDLNHEGGTLTVGNGTLIVHGDYRMQRRYDGQYMDSTGTLNMTSSEGTISIDGDLIIQTNSTTSKLNAGTIRLGGNLYQKNTSDNDMNFVSGTGLNLLLSEERSHVIHFENGETNSIGWLTLDNDVTIQNNINIGIMDNNGHNMTINGNLSSTSSIELYDYDLKADISEIGSVALQNNMTVQSVPLYHDIDLNGHQLNVNGDMILSGDADLNSGVLTVTGNLYHYSGALFIDNGKLNVTGNYYSIGSDSVFETGKENITDGYGCLKMTYAADEVHISGDMLIKTYAYDSSANNQLSAGTLYIGGNFKQLSSSWTSSNFICEEDHRTVLNGTGTQTISFESGYSGFGTLESTNDQLVFEDNINWLVQGSDIHATSEGASLKSRSINLNGYKLTLDGDTSVESSIDLKNGEITVNGSLYHYSGAMTVNGGKLNVTGNYYSIGSDSVFETGKENITDGYGCLKMTYAADEVHISGDMLIKTYAYDSSAKNQLSAGTLYIGGNFKQLSSSWTSSNFICEEDHRTVLNGAGTQTISFESGYSHFGTLELTQPLGMYVFFPDPCWITLILPESMTFGTPDYTLPASLTKINESAFEGIAAKVVYVPDTCASIGAYAFRNASVMKIRVPKNCAIAPTAFEGCESVTIFGVKGSSAEAYCEVHDNCTFIAR